MRSLLLRRVPYPQVTSCERKSICTPCVPQDGEEVFGMLSLESIGCVLTPVRSFPRPLSMPSQPHRRQWMGPLGRCGGMAEVLPRTLSQHLLGLLRL